MMNVHLLKMNELEQVISEPLDENIIYIFE